jgi:xanthine/CO dehydrogenase XdhC/CoxF family maturation factor
VRAADSARASAYIPVEDEREGAMGEQDDVLEQLRDWQDGGRQVAVATVVSTWGSSPRPVGSQLGINDKGEMVGSVSGGCIEGAVVREALEVMAGAPPKLLDYGVSNEQAWEVGLACGGKLEVYIEAVA